MYVRREQRDKAVFLYHVPEGDALSEPVAIGTGFLLRSDLPGDEPANYLVTAKHVLEGLTRVPGRLLLRLNVGDRTDARRPGEGVAYIEIERTGWLFHEDETVDAVAGPLDKIIRTNRLFGHAGPVDVNQGDRLKVSMRLDVVSEILDAPAYLAKQQDCPWPPFEGEDIIFIGLMVHFQGEETNLPLIRRGSIALVTDELIKGPYGPSKYHVINAQIYPGNSGSPVWVYLPRADDGTGLHSFYYLGLLSPGYPQLEELRAMPQTPNGYYNLGTGLVTPIEKVLEILNSPQETTRRRERRAPTAP